MHQLLENGNSLEFGLHLNHWYSHLRTLLNIFQLQLKEFRLLFLAQALGYFGFYVPYAHIVSYSIQVGISSTVASILLAVMGGSVHDVSVLKESFWNIGKIGDGITGGYSTWKIEFL